MTTQFLPTEEGSNRKTGLSFSEYSIFPILTSRDLLASNQRKKWLLDIRTLVEAPDQHFVALYQNLIEDFAAMVQVLPTNNEARLYSLLDEALLRCIFVLQLQRTEKSEVKFTPLMTYVLATAALLFDIGYVMDNRMVLISDKEGAMTSEWFPHQGPMQLEQGFYKIRRGGGWPSWVCRRMSVPLARQIMPSLGFDWIAKDPYALNTWLSLLTDDKEGAGAMSLFFKRAAEMLEEFKSTPEFFVPIDIEALNPEGTKVGEDFLAWLKKGLKDGSISVNKEESNVQVVKSGAVLNLDALMKKFSSSNAAAAKAGADALRRQLAALGAIRGGGEVKYRYGEPKADAFHFVKPKEAASVASSLFGPQKESKPDQNIGKIITDFAAHETGRLFVESAASSTTAARGGKMGIMLNELARNIVLGQMVAAENAKVQIVETPRVAQENLANKFPTEMQMQAQRAQNLAWVAPAGR